ncbi:MAG TPA: hypothetical protein VGI93_12560 [Steroidobacteraceae bacterium]|jgi:hypothetical protein
MRLIILGLYLCLAGCAAHAVRCDSHLQPINSPAPKPAGESDHGSPPP